MYKEFEALIEELNFNLFTRQKLLQMVETYQPDYKLTYIIMGLYAHFEEGGLLLESSSREVIDYFIKVISYFQKNYDYGFIKDEIDYVFYAIVMFSKMIWEGRH